MNTGLVTHLGQLPSSSRRPVDEAVHIGDGLLGFTLVGIANFTEKDHFCGGSDVVYRGCR